MDHTESIHGFTVISRRDLPELDARLHQMEHEKTGAKLVWLERAEENKTFGIAFRTLPWNDTGVFHILEHSVLSGSERYPVKEPFVELMKSSMKTFLNAMTFPDKTFYPISSRNDKDFLNLIRVYMDAVLHPLIYSRPEIFYQEGWHYELDGDGSPTYKGVVFNEMKGAFASPDALTQDEMNRLLFPDTCYCHVSGGDPAHIPELTYEQFLDSHRRFYHPSNAYIFLDGQMDVKMVLSILDGEYLSAYTREEQRTEIPWQAPVKPAPVQTFYEISPNESTVNRARLAWGYVLGGHSCREERMGVQALADTLCGSNQAPLKRRVLSQGLAQDVHIDLVDGIQQPYVVLEIQNMDESRRVDVEDAVREELRRLADGGLDHEHLASALANLEFQLRERDYGGMPQGLGFGIDVLDSWLYGGDPAANLENDELFASLNRKLEEGWFEDLLERVFLDNPHSCQVLLLPSPTLGDEKREQEATRLRRARESWNEEEAAALRQRQKKLEAWQASKDTPETLSKLPKLSLGDIPAQPGDLPTEMDKLAGRPLLRHPISTNGISYVSLYFDISDFSHEKLSVASFLCRLLGDLDTADHSGIQLQKLRRMTMGDLSFAVEAHGGVNAPETCRIFLRVSFSALDGKLGAAAALAAEIITKTRFDDRRMLLDLLRQSITEMEQNIINAGSNFAMTRISAGYSAQGAAQEYTGGFTFYQKLKSLDADFDDSASRLTEDLTGLRAAIFDRSRLTISVTGANTDAAAVVEAALMPRLACSEEREIPCAVHPWGKRREGIVIPADISFAALGGNLLAHGGQYRGATRVLGRIASLAYLWNVIRVQGGAYGTGLAVGDSGGACFYSYRDPSAARSLDCYRQAAGFIRQFCDAKPDLTGFIIGAVAESDPLMLPHMRGKAADSLYLKGITYADRCRLRREMLSVTPDMLSTMAGPLQELSNSGNVCVIGSHRQIEACGPEIDTVYKL